ncbi:MAG: hypothetical protein ACTSUR_03620 [Candidatus Heimdallarchaeaceae archaeon]
MMGFYIVNKEKMEILFCRPLTLKKDEAEADKIVKLLISFYEKSKEENLLEELQILKFKKTKVIFMTKFSFLFILLSPPNYSTEMVSSQLFFFMKLFLNAFEIKDEQSANEFLQEVEGIKRRQVSESLSHSFLLWNVLDLHIEDIDKRNMIEVYENVLNAIWLGIRMFIIEEMSIEAETKIVSLIENYKEFITKNLLYLKESCRITEEEGFDFCEVDTQKGTSTEIRREFLLLLKHIITNLEEEVGIEELRKIIAYRVPDTIKVEWERLVGLDLIQDILSLVWR